VSEWDIGELIYLILLGGVLIYWFLNHNRNSVNKTLQQAAAWVLIFFGVVAVIGLWEDIQRTVRPSQSVFAEQGRVEVPRAPDGHYYLTLMVNDAPVKFIVDTGASGVVLTRQDARRAGIDLDGLNFLGRANTANGEVRTAPVWLDHVALGDIVVRDQAAWVNEGEMEKSLLGMTYLQQWSQIQIRDGRLILVR